MVGQKYFKEGGKLAFGEGQKYTKYNKINSIQKTSGGKIAAYEFLPNFFQSAKEIINGISEESSFEFLYDFSVTMRNYQA